MDINADNLRTFFPRLLTAGGEEDHELLSAALRPRRLAAGEPYIQRGGRSASLALVVHGRLAITLRGGLREMPLGETGPGGWVGELSVIRPDEALADVHALTDALLWELSHEEFERLRKEHPRAASRLLHTLCQSLVERLRRSTDRLIEQARAGDGPSGIL